ncbi:MAG TPA: prepilin-type N-terminal cleavage/methylation domain-containing protein [Candidatus Saccharimonadales bacterium]|nr:prepilin-type N-terminal cleavage/methylation domain-containing protein [Candidatus Saccharimonadales bacterium]
MSTWRRAYQAGDTIIEVLLAIVIISVVITGAYQATNSGLRIGQNSIERTQAAELTSAQAEALRSLRDLKGTSATMATAWTAAAAKATTTLPAANVCASGGGTPTSGSNPFWLNGSTNPVTVTTGTTTSNYLKYWVEAYQPSASSGYIDFYVMGCWQALGEPAIQNIGLVVRLGTN